MTRRSDFTIGILLDPYLGSRIQDVATQAVEFRKTYVYGNAVVGFHFNRFYFEVRPDTTAEELIDEYHNRLAKR